MSEMKATAPVRSAELSAVVLRCRCTNPASHAGQPCPLARAEELGKIAFWHKNPVLRLLGNLRLRGRNLRLRR